MIRSPIAAVLLMATLALAACHTVAGVGQDVSGAGHAVSNAANKATP